MDTPAQPPLIKVRRTEPSDYVGVQRIFSMPRAVWGTLQIPYPSAEMWRKRFAEPPEGSYQLVACVDEEVIGHIGLHTFPNHPRRRHVGQSRLDVGRIGGSDRRIVSCGRPALS